MAFEGYFVHLRCEIYNYIQFSNTNLNKVEDYARDNWVRKYDNKPHGDIDVAIAAEHLCLAATERGLGTCWVCAYDSNKMKELFPREGYEAVVIIPLGHMAEDCPHNPKNRKAMDEIIEEI